jgi:radical SAM protein with 4Fe4S-binding SPASM domain
MTEHPHKLLSISIAITQRCNLSCFYCSRNAGPTETLDFGLEDLANVLRSLQEYRAHQVKVFALSGGEPFLHPEFFSFLDAIAHHGYGITLNSNLTLLPERMLQRLKSYPIYKIVTTFDGCQECTHDGVRGGGSFRKTSKNIKRLVDSGFKIFIKTVLRKENLAELEGIVCMGQALGVQRVGVHRRCALGRARIMTDGITFAEALPYLEACYCRAKELGIEFSYDDPLKIFVDPELVEYRDELLGELAGCSAGKYMLNILTDGSVVPCPAFCVGIANICRDTVENIFENNPVLTKLRTRGVHSCSSCVYTNICGGCRSRSLSSSGDFFDEDPLCPMVRRTASSAKSFPS